MEAHGADAEVCEIEGGEREARGRREGGEREGEREGRGE